MVPEGWKTEKLGNYIKLSSGDTKPENIEKEMSTMSPYPVFGGNNVMGFSNSYNSEGSVILIGRVGEYCGVTRYVDQRCWITDNALFTKDISPDLNAEFLVSKLKYLDLSRLRNKGGQPLVSQKPIYGLKLTVPPLPEQKKIAQILSTWDQAITATERLLENSQKRKKGLMQQLLTGKKRLPGFEGEWETKPIAQTGKIISGGTPDTTNSDLWGGDVQWLTPTDITALKTHFIYDTPRKLTEKGVKESSATLLPTGSICVCTRASVGLMAISTTPITTNQGFKSVVPNDENYKEFLYYLFSFNRHVFVRYSSGSTFLELSKKDFVKIAFEYPPLAEQKAIARVLTSVNDEIEQIQKRIDCLKQEKKALMQQLLTGKRRVNVDKG